jgi:hypothetical protein
VAKPSEDDEGATRVDRIMREATEGRESMDREIREILRRAEETEGDDAAHSLQGETDEGSTR